MRYETQGWGRRAFLGLAVFMLVVGLGPAAEAGKYRKTEKEKRKAKQKQSMTSATGTTANQSKSKSKSKGSSEAESTSGTTADTQGSASAAGDSAGSSSAGTDSTATTGTTSSTDSGDTTSASATPSSSTYTPITSPTTSTRTSVSKTQGYWEAWLQQLMRSITLHWGFGGEILPSNLPVVSGDLGFSIRPADLGFDRAHEDATGQGVIVAVLDGGFNLDHPFIAGNVMLGYDVIDQDSDVSDPGNGYDDDWDGIVDGALGHGTFVAGMVLMSAPDAMILPIRVADDEGRSTTSEIATGIDYALSMGADVINISVGTIIQNDSLTKYLTYAAQSGVLIIVSAGNDGTDQLRFLASDPATIAVGSTDGSDCLASFSNRGAGVSIFAPGVDLYGPFGGALPDSWAQWSGTSFSAGFVSGAAALAKELHPEITRSTFEWLLQESGHRVYSTDGSEELEGLRRLDLEKLVEEIDELLDD